MFMCSVLVAAQLSSIVTIVPLTQTDQVTQCHWRRLARCQVPGARCQVPGAKCQVPSARCQVPGASCQKKSRKVKKKMYIYLYIDNLYFRRISPLGRFGLVVAKSVRYCCPRFMCISQGSKGGPRGAKPSPTVAY